MTTLQELISASENDLGDPTNTYFAAADIEQWLRDAISDYSLHYPRARVASITTAADDRRYDLPADFKAPLSVEYPQGEDPPEYLKRRPWQHPDFWTEDGFFDIAAKDDDTAVNELLISQKPAASETIEVTYQAHHDNTIGLSTPVTVPDEHHFILRNYVLWRAALQLKSKEEVNPTSNSSLLMAQLAQNVDRARRQYIDSLAKAVFSESKTAVVSWANQAKETKRVY